MTNQMTFRRYELKYLLTPAQKTRLLQAMAPYMQPDEHGRSTVRNLYFDTESYRLIRRSLEKPVYKEKLRVRSYAPARGDDPVFVELKKKYKSVVYKRRIVLPEAAAMHALETGAPLSERSQIAREIDYFRAYYGTLRPRVFLCYDREAFFERDGDLRVTFDENVRYRTQALTLGGDTDGIPLLDGDQTLLELKTAGAMPLWLCDVLTQERIYKASFSKYGAAYQHLLTAAAQGGLRYA